MLRGVGLCLVVGGRGGPLHAGDLGLVAAAAEGEGFGHLWVAEERAASGSTEAEPATGVTSADAITVAAALARLSTRIGVGVLTDAAGGRAPSLLGKELTTLDHLSNGRAALGLGWVPWTTRSAATGPGPSTQAAVELPPGGAPIGTGPTVRGLLDRARWLDDAAAILRGMWGAPSFTFAGAHLAVTEAVNHPPPVQRGGPALMFPLTDRSVTLQRALRHRAAVVTAGSPASIERTLRVASSLGATSVPVLAWRQWDAARSADELASDVATVRQAGAAGAIVALERAAAPHGRAAGAGIAEQVHCLAGAVRAAGA